MKNMRETSVPKIWDRKGLPGWAYHSPTLLELEIDLVFLSLKVKVNIVKI